MKTKIENILNKYEQIKFALLFGSYANNTQKYLSDIDIGIYTKDDIDLFLQGEIISDLESELDKKIDLVILNDLFKKNSKLSFNIINNHSLIFCKEKDKYTSFKENSMKYYFDMKFMYDQFDEALKKRIEDGTYGKTKAS